MLAAAAALIVEKGWEATTAAEIGRRAGYSRAMVHARFGGKDAILEAFLHQYARHLNPDPDPADRGMDQVLAHFHRIEQVYDEGPELLRAMFVATFEAVKSTSPLRERVRTQLRSGAAKVEAGLRAGIADGSVRSGIEIDAAVHDITAAVFGIAFQWVAVPEEHDLRTEITRTRDRIVREYGPAARPRQRARL